MEEGEGGRETERRKRGRERSWNSQMYELDYYIWIDV